MANIKKIKLSNGQVYGIFDTGALRLNDDNILITGNGYVDNLIINGHLSILEVDDASADDYTKILVQNSATGVILGRDKDEMLSDVGGYSAAVEDYNLILKLGKQES